ncbi:MAG: HlyC/CorC family transporter, partial [Planctomycetales bacterium]|nr:HlyC/CorC family transporter [Planctomycetales bacterium]
PQRFGEILDEVDRAAIAAQYLLLFGLVIGSLAAGAWFFTSGDVEHRDGKLWSEVSRWTMIGWITSWLVLLTLAGLWLPRIVVRYSSSFFLFHSWPVWKGLAILTGPFSGLGDVFSWLGQRLTDEPEDDNFDEEMLEDEIRTMLTTGQREGVFSEGVPEMIQGVMDLDENDVQSIMTPRSLVDAINVDAPWDEVLAFVADCGRTRLPVYRGNFDNVIGILFVKDLLCALVDKSFEPTAESLELMLRKPWFIPESKPVDELLRVFLHNRNHMAIVVDAYHQVAGVVTIEDALEEIVGEIADELDVDEDSEIFYDEDTHRIEAEGKVPVESIGQLLGVNLPESDDYDTVGGLVVHRLSEIPTVGTTVELNGIRITVLRASKRVVQRVRIELVDSDNISAAT